MSDQHQFTKVLADLERIRLADKPFGRPRLWLRLRRLVIVADCCKEYPLAEVMSTDPPCVLVGQVEVKSQPCEERKHWAGVHGARGSQGVVWLSTFERMADANARQMVPCRHRRWWIPARDVVTQRGRHILTLADSSGQSG